jgi:hypothetical protein
LPAKPGLPVGLFDAMLIQESRYNRSPSARKGLSGSAS